MVVVSSCNHFLSSVYFPAFFLSPKCPATVPPATSAHQVFASTIAEPLGCLYKHMVSVFLLLLLLYHYQFLLGLAVSILPLLLKTCLR